MASPSASASGSEDHRGRKTLDDDNDDRISQLPESLLVQILSLLPTNEAFRTSILSKRWKYLWTLVYNFNFDFYLKGGIVKKFESFVDYVLAHCNASKIEKFKLRGPYLSESNVNRCLNFAVERNVEHVVLMLDEPILIPESFYACSSLITLDINDCGFRRDIAMSWKSLKSVKLDNVELSNEDIVKLLAGCPELENMELKDVACYRRLGINSLKLKRLYLKDLRLDEENTEFSLEIFAPSLQYFGISGDLEFAKFRLIDVSSMINAKLDFSNSCFSEEWYGEDCENDHQGFITLIRDNLQKLSCATELTLGSWFTEVLNMLQLKGVSIPELKCKYLTLELDEVFSLYGAAGILRALPHVETLNIDVFRQVSRRFGRSRCNFELKCLAEGDNIDLQSWISSFEFPNLKKVKIVHSTMPCLTCFSNLKTSNQGVDKFFKLSEFLLKNAAILEKFVISSRITCKICSNFCVSPFVYQMPMRLLGCPRASMNCMILPELRFP